MNPLSDITNQIGVHNYAKANTSKRSYLIVIDNEVAQKMIANAFSFFKSANLNLGCPVEVTARCLGISKTTVSQYKNGSQDSPKTIKRKRPKKATTDLHTSVKQEVRLVLYDMVQQSKVIFTLKMAVLFKSSCRNRKQPFLNGMGRLYNGIVDKFVFVNKFFPLKMEELLIAGTSSDVEEKAQQAIAELLPAKSRERYWKKYTFLEWRKRKKISEVTENVTTAYFSEKAKHFKSSSLWCQSSMLKKTLMVKEDIDISRFLKLKAYVESRPSGYVPKKSKTFTGDDIEKFLKEAPEKQYLMHKVVMVMGVAGACRCDELHRLTLDDIQEKNDILLVKIPITKTGKPRSFVVSDPAHVQICKKYLALRHKIMDHKRFFICYRNEKCTVQGVGINTFGKIPTLIAQYLNLPEATKYTGHCFRRTSATLLVDGGGDTLTLMRHGGWSSSTVAQGYLEDSLGQKLDAAQKICRGRKRLTTSRPCTSTTDNYEETTPEKVLVVQHPSPVKTSIVKVTSSLENSSVLVHTVEIPSSNNAAPIFVFNSCSSININNVK